MNSTIAGTIKAPIKGRGLRWYRRDMGLLLTMRRTVDLCRLGSFLCLAS